MSADPLALTACEAAAAIAAGQLSSEALTEAALAAAEASDLNAFVAIDRDAALARARALDAQVGRGGFHGVPMAHKDMFHRAGQPCECGTLIRRGWIAPDTGPLLAALDDAGQVQIGRLHMSEFAMGPSGHNAHLGRARNPWNRAYITGGSSSGSAAVVAARIVFGALGSDTGGSVRLPAACCGVVGLKPTQGLVSQAGMMPLSHSLDSAGPLARSTRDTARMLDAMTGRRGHYEAAAGRPVAGMTVGLPRQYYFDDLDADVAGAMEAARGVLESLGVRCVAVDVPDQADLADLATILFTPEAAALHREWLRDRPEDYGPQVRARLLQGLTVSAVDYLSAGQLRAWHARAMAEGPFAQVDALLTPALRIMVPTGEATDVAAGAAMAETVSRLAANTRPANYLGVPAIVTPAGFDGAGLPIGLQLIGPAGGEAALIALAAAHEAATDWLRHRPGQTTA